MRLKLPCRRCLPLIWAVLSSICSCCLVEPQPATAASPNFAQQVRPILAEKCFHCHGPDAQTRQADLRLDVAESARLVLTATGDDTSELLDRITTHDVELRMPPAEAIKQLTEQEIQILTQWIDSGAAYSEHWSFVKPVRGQPPSACHDSWCTNPIDAFVLESMRQQGMHPSPMAAPETLARRVSLDLIGLPPTPQQLSQFRQNATRHGFDSAYSQWIDHLMSTPQYGEHMALPWLEAARYADTDGYQNDRYRYQHAWRDWVIRSLNENMPYDQFVIEQLAGDLLPNATLWQQVATGFCRNHRINSEDGSIPEEWLTENVVDRVDTLGTVFLGLTIGCARCHDHKYDPISQTEYYQLFAYFNNVAEHGVGPNNGNSPPFVELPSSWPLLSAQEDHALVPEPVKLRRSREADNGNGLKRPQAGEPSTVMVMHELPEPRETYLLMRGQYNMPDKSQRLWPALPAALSGTSAESLPPKSRLELAQWLVGPDNPLTARVAVNRVWQQFFGRGIVESSDNFGAQGTLPTHPQLLDWLAVEFVESGWDLRHIQKLILQSATYRQASTMSPELLESDPHNHYLARGPRRRVPAFVLRDQALAVSGLLVQRVGGPSVKPYMPADIWSSISNNKYEQDSGESLFRRSLYTYWRRTIPPPTMMNFNAAAREVCTVRTEATNTPLQALTLMNNVSFIEAAKKLAERELHHGSTEQQIQGCFERCTSRVPTAMELQILTTAHKHFLQTYRSQPEAATELLAQGEAPYDTRLPQAELAALTMTASLILNLDEVISNE